MYNTFNMGVGMVLAVDPADADKTIEAIKARETYDTEDWLIIITSDHGGIGTDHGSASIQERMTFIVANKEFDYE